MEYSFSSKNMTLNVKDKVPYLTYNRLSHIDFITHGFSTKYGGVSTGEFTSMNLAFNRGDNPQNVLENYRLLAQAVGVDFNTLVASAQDHHTVVRCVDKSNIGTGITKPRDLQSVDALITNKPDVTLVTYYADCTPIFFVDTSNKVIALAHGGWKGTAGRIVQKVIATMTDKYGTDPKNVVAAVGPAIGKCCYEVDINCARHFMDLNDVPNYKIITEKPNGKYMLDLPMTNAVLLQNSGVLCENIVISDVCTKCHSDLLWSHRATKGHRGTMAAVMCMPSSKQ